ncbi:hypothetical protein AB0H77_25550 [Streptomyces sp. NPDC050844]|uniref:hypothetical protein n=1 Tax=Streptomyces sp. NPDC050844 TaxID=3155790 RepID=UPI00340BC45C
MSLQIVPLPLHDFRLALPPRGFVQELGDLPALLLKSPHRPLDRRLGVRALRGRRRGCRDGGVLSAQLLLQGDDAARVVHILRPRKGLPSALI